MRHNVLRNLGQLGTATDEMLEFAVDQIIAECEMAGDFGFDGERASRAEALAILSHEIRRRESK